MSLLKIVIFHSYISLPEDTPSQGTLKESLMISLSILLDLGRALPWLVGKCWFQPLWQWCCWFFAIKSRNNFQKASFVGGFCFDRF
jgi:hypothetical protein